MTSPAHPSRRARIGAAKDRVLAEELSPRGLLRLAFRDHHCDALHPEWVCRPRPAHAAICCRDFLPAPRQRLLQGARSGGERSRRCPGRACQVLARSRVDHLGQGSPFSCQESSTDGGSSDQPSSLVVEGLQEAVDGDRTTVADFQLFLYVRCAGDTGSSQLRV